MPNEIVVHVKADSDLNNVGRTIGVQLGRSLSQGLSTGGATGAASGGAQSGGSIISMLFSNPYSAGAAIAAGLATLPFAAQAAGAGMVAGLGAGLAGLGAIAAMRLKGPQKAFADFQKDANQNLKQIGLAFAPVMDTLFRVASRTFSALTPSLTRAMKDMAPALNDISRSLGQGLAQPAVKTAIDAIAKSFGDMMKALAPQIPGMIKSIADGITAIAKAIDKNPGVFAAFINFLAKAIGVALKAIAVLIDVATYIEQHFGPAMHRVAVIFDGVRHEIAHIWDMIWNNTVSRIERGVHDVRDLFDGWRHDIATWFDNTRHDIASKWDNIWNTTKTKVTNGINDVVNFFKGLPGKIATALLGLGTKLWNLAHTWLTDMLNGAKSVISAITSFFTGLPGRILGWLGIHSPPDWAINAGKQIMHGIGIGMEQAHDRVAQATRAVNRSIPGLVSGAGGAMAIAKRLLAAMGWSNQWGAFNSLVMAESGWNVSATNPTSGAYGIPQALPPGKMASAGADWRTNPETQLRWMMGYIRSVYGDPINAWAHEQAVHWYGSGLSGGIFSRPTLIGVGERGAERVDITPFGSGGQRIALEVMPGGASAFEQFMVEAIRNWVRIKGGGSVQTAFGRN